MKLKKIYVIRGLLVSFVCLLMLVIFFLIQPDVVAHITRKGFDSSGKEVVYPRHSAYEEKIATIESIENINYPSIYAENTMDIYYTKDMSNPKPLLIWVHGGAFVGGDKRDCRDYLKMLASEGYVVANMNYALAPEAHYPIPIYQVAEVSQFLKHKEIINFDEQQIFIGGDSAGTQIAGQFTLTQMDKNYGTQVGIESIWEQESIKGFLSFSGLLVLSEFDETDSWISNFLYHQSAWSYFGSFKWKKSSQGLEADFINSMTNFPPMFLTDGNNNSFLSQAQQFSNQLQDLGIPYTEVYYEESLAHEYQFDMSLPASLASYDAVVLFLNTMSED